MKELKSVVLGLAMAFSAFAPGIVEGALWTYAPSLTLDRDMLGVTKDRNGTIFAIGGFYEYYQTQWIPTDTVETFNGTSWSPLAARLLQPHGNGGAATDKYGDVYAIYGGDVERYDPSVGVWESRKPMNDPVRVGGFGTATDVQGNIYAIGGADLTSKTASVERYDPDSDSWQYIAPLSAARGGLTAATDSFGRIYAIGGYMGSLNLTTDFVERYDPRHPDWGWVPDAPIPTARQYAAAVLGPDGDIWVVGGNDSGSVDSVVEVFTPSTSLNDSGALGHWTTGPSLEQARNGMGAAVSDSGSIYAVGGGGWDSPVNTVEVLITAEPPTLLLLLQSLGMGIGCVAYRHFRWGARRERKHPSGGRP